MTVVQLPDHTQGDTFSYQFNFSEAATELVPDLSQHNWYMTIKINPGLPDDDPMSVQSFIAAGSQVEAANGSLMFSIPSTEMAKLPPANYHFDVQRVTPDTNPPVVNTYLKGRIRITPQVTQAV